MIIKMCPDSGTGFVLKSLTKINSEFSLNYNILLNNWTVCDSGVSGHFNLYSTDNQRRNQVWDLGQYRFSDQIIG